MNLVLFIYLRLFIKFYPSGSITEQSDLSMREKVSKRDRATAFRDGTKRLNGNDIEIIEVLRPVEEPVLYNNFIDNI